MATVLFVVKATIPRKKEAAFNRWYSYKHCPQFLRYPGAVSARRYRAILGEDKIGRASCRGRVEISVVAVSLKKKTQLRDDSWLCQAVVSGARRIRTVCDMQ